MPEEIQKDVVSWCHVPLMDVGNKSTTCSFFTSQALEDHMAGCTVWHLDVDTLPDWILSVINQVLLSFPRVT